MIALVLAGLVAVAAALVALLVILARRPPVDAPVVDSMGELLRWLDRGGAS